MWRTTHIGEHQTRKPKRKTLNITIVSKGKVAFVHLQKKFNSLPKILVRHPEVIALKYNISVNTCFFSVFSVLDILCIEILAYRLCGFVGDFARPQIYSLPSEWCSFCNNSLFHKGTT